MNKKTQRLTVSAIFIALSTVLSFLGIARLPYGGEITPLSMLPIVMLAYMFGVKWGAVCGAAYGILQAIFGATLSAAFAGQSIGAVLGIIFFDYLIAFTALSLAGLFKGKIKNHTVAFTLGTLIATLFRYIAHIVSGCIFFGSYAAGFFAQESTSGFGTEVLEKFSGTRLIIIYSTIYNGTYMVPEIVLTTVAAAFLIALVKPVRKELTGDGKLLNRQG